MDNKEYLKLRQSIQENNRVVQKYEELTFTIEQLKDSVARLEHFLNGKEMKDMIYHVDISTLEKSEARIRLHGKDIIGAVQELITSAKSRISELTENRNRL